MCYTSACRHGVKVHLKNGKIRYIVSVVSCFTNSLGKFICFSKFCLRDCRQGARNFDTNAKEATQGFLLIHLISDLLLKQGGGCGYINSDPVSGQAAWYDLRAKVEKAPKGATNTELLFKVLMPPQSISGRS